jgi:hypothetical protein
LSQCEALLKRFIPAFSITNLDELVRQQQQQEAAGPASAIDAGTNYSQEPISPPGALFFCFIYFSFFLSSIENHSIRNILWSIL